MAMQQPQDDWSVTPEKTAEAVRRIVAHADPLQVILFGSRARGNARPESDLDLAVVLDAPEEELRQRLPHSVLRGLRMEVSLIVASKAKFDLHRPWQNSIFHSTDQEGIVLYDRSDPKSAYTGVVQAGTGGRIGPVATAA
jgi:predicted nucleotidyltransferase